MKKKGSLELSINAIVILVLAITLLGLGLTFIRGLFGKATDKLGGFVDSADLENPPTSENPISIPDTIELKIGENRELKVGYYNNNQKDTGPFAGTLKEAKFKIAGNSCSPQLTSLSMTSSEQDVAASKSAGYKTILSLPSGTQGTYVCSIVVEGKIGTAGLADIISKQIFIIVSS